MHSFSSVVLVRRPSFTFCFCTFHTRSAFVSFILKTGITRRNLIACFTSAPDHSSTGIDLDQVKIQNKSSFKKIMHATQWYFRRETRLFTFHVINYGRYERVVYFDTTLKICNCKKKSQAIDRYTKTIPRPVAKPAGGDKAGSTALATERVLPPLVGSLWG